MLTLAAAISEPLWCIWRLVSCLPRAENYLLLLHILMAVGEAHLHLALQTLTHSGDHMIFSHSSLKVSCWAAHPNPNLFCRGFPAWRAVSIQESHRMV